MFDDFLPIEARNDAVSSSFTLGSEDFVGGGGMDFVLEVRVEVSVTKFRLSSSSSSQDGERCRRTKAFFFVGGWAVWLGEEVVVEALEVVEVVVGGSVGAVEGADEEAALLGAVEVSFDGAELLPKLEPNGFFLFLNLTMFCFAR